MQNLIVSSQSLDRILTALETMRGVMFMSLQSAKIKGDVEGVAEFSRRLRAISLVEYEINSFMWAENRDEKITHPDL